MKVLPYLNFDGKAEKAFMFYKSVFGGEFLANMKMSEMLDADKLPTDEQNRTMHIALPIGEGTILMASDTVPSAGHKMVFGNQTHIMLSPDTKQEANKLFDGLSKDGIIDMKMEEASWGDYFGGFTDKFGIKWMINVDGLQN